MDRKTEELKEKYLATKNARGPFAPETQEAIKAWLLAYDLEELNKQGGLLAVMGYAKTINAP